MLYQTDFTGFIRNDGCLFFDLVDIAETKTGFNLDHLQLTDLIYVLHHKINCSYDKNRPVLSDEDDINKPGIFVWDHEVVVHQALFFMNIINLKIEYIGRIYLPWEEARGKKSFGIRANADELILQIRTINGGHFRRPNYDSWESGTHMIDLKSIRYYRWI